MYRLASCLASLAMISLPACKREAGGANNPDSTQQGQDGVASPQSPTPTPEQVCVRLSEMAAVELGAIDPQVQRETVDMCTQQMLGEQQMRGPENWDGIARCVVAAQTDVDIERCDSLYPAPASASAGTPEGVSQEDQVCVIMISTFAVELALEAEKAGLPPPELADDDIREAHTECLRSLEQARQNRTGAAYDSLLECLAGAESTPALDQCMGGGA